MKVSEAHTAFVTNLTTAKPNSARASHYSMLQQAIQTMCKLPLSHNLHVDAKAAQRASDILGMISENFEVSPPKVLPQDGEAVVFTWDFGDIKRYLSIDEEEVDVLDLHKTLMTRFSHEITIDGDHPYAAIIELVGSKPSSVTSSPDKDI